MSSTTTNAQPDDNKPFNLDLNKTSRFNSNVWVLGVIIMGTVAGYALVRDLRESDRDAFREIVQNQKENIERYQQQTERYNRQEKHFEFSDARLSELEKRSTATERVMEKISANVEYLVKREQQK